MTEENPKKLRHWSKTILLWLLIPIGALIAKDIYDYAKLSVDPSKANPTAAVVQKKDAEKTPELPKGLGSGALLEQFTKIVPQAPVSGASVEGKNNKSIPMPLIIAAKNGHIKIVEIMLQRGADVNVRDKEQGTTPLIAAAQQGHKEIVDILLKSGADVNARDTSGKTALSEATRNEHAEIVKLLKERGAN